MGDRADASGLPATIPHVAVKLNSKQEANVRAVLQVAHEDGWSPMETLAGIETIGVEANYENPDYGDRDSLGAFQQRTPWGSRESRLNVTESARRFGQRAKAARQKGQFRNAGELAQAVQVSGFPDRYQAKRGEALQILKQYGAGITGGSSSGAAAGSLASAVNSPANDFDPTRGQVSNLELARPVQQPVGTAPAAPLQPQVAMPAGYGQTPLSGSPQELAPAAQDPLANITPTDASLPEQAQQQDAAAGGSDSSTTNEAGFTTAGAKPRVKIAAGANAVGKPMTSRLLGLLDKISSEADLPITVTTGTNHSKFTTTGSVSNHYTGDGADVASTGKELTNGATDALLVLARGKKVQWLKNDGSVVSVRLTAANTRKLVEAGGIFNVPHGKGKIQVIANTHLGGDHTNHWHLGVS